MGLVGCSSSFAIHICNQSHQVNTSILQTSVIGYDRIECRILLQIQNEIKQVTKRLGEQREEHNATEVCIMSAEKASHEGLGKLLSKFKTQKAGLQETRKHIAALSEKGIKVHIT